MSIDTLVDLGTQLVLTVGVLVLGLIVVRMARQRIVKRVIASENIPDGRKKQIQTIVQVVGWIVNVTIIGVATMMLLGHFVDIAPLLASVGVMGLALSLGAQTLIKDLIGGLLILIENQYAVGDVIQVGAVAGAVERLTLRATYVRDINGKLHLIPNGDVRTVSNVTRGWSRAVVDIGVAYEEDLDRVVSVLEEEAQRFAEDPDFASQLLEPPRIIGPTSLGDWAVTMRVMVKTEPGKQWGVAMDLRKRMLVACDRERITLPYPRQEVLVRDRYGDEVAQAGE